MAEDNDPAGGRPAAGALIEQSVEAEAAGDQERADELMAQAEKIDPTETISVLDEQAAATPDSSRAPAARRTKERTK